MRLIDYSRRWVGLLEGVAAAVGEKQLWKNEKHRCGEEKKNAGIRCVVSVQVYKERFACVE